MVLGSEKSSENEDSSGWILRKGGGTTQEEGCSTDAPERDNNADMKLSGRLTNYKYQKLLG